MFELKWGVIVWFVALFPIFLYLLRERQIKIALLILGFGMVMAIATVQSTHQAHPEIDYSKVPLEAWRNTKIVADWAEENGYGVMCCASKCEYLCDLYREKHNLSFEEFPTVCPDFW